jgi:histidine ammonia-lyase
MKTIVIDGKNLTLDELSQVSYASGKSVRVVLSLTAKKEIAFARKFIESKLSSDEAIYGVNTGFGMLSNVRISKDKLSELQVNLIRSHSVGVGPALSIPEVRAAILLRANTLASGHSGVSVAVVEALLSLLNSDINPYIPEQGSVGACGDLAPLAHMALCLIGEGKAFYNGKLIAASKALKSANLSPYSLKPKEGLSLINGTQVMTAVASLTLLKAKRLCDLADVAAAMSVEGLKGSITPFDPKISGIRPHRGQKIVAARMTKLLQQSQIMESHADCDKVQDPYSLRCVPQVHGICRDVIDSVKDILETEINAVTDNPLVFAKEKQILSGGNFHGEYVAVAMDQLAIAIQELASISEQRIAKLVNPTMSGLPAFLAKDGGLNSGFMIVHVAAASLVSENKVLCHPASVDSIPTSADKEDHVSMGTIAAIKCRKVLQNVWNVISMEFLCASQAVEFHWPLKPSKNLIKVQHAIRKRVPLINKDRSFYVDMAKISQMMEDEIPAFSDLS